MKGWKADVTCLYLQQNKPEDHSECTSEAVNTRLFLALETLIGNKQQFADQ